MGQQYRSSVDLLISARCARTCREIEGRPLKPKIHTQSQLISPRMRSQELLPTEQIFLPGLAWHDCVRRRLSCYGRVALRPGEGRSPISRAADDARGKASAAPRRQTFPADLHPPTNNN